MVSAWTSRKPLPAFLAEVPDGQPDLVASHLAPLSHQTDDLPDHLFGESHVLVLSGDGQHPISEEEPDTQSVLDESGVLVTPAKEDLHFRPGGQGNALSSGLFGSIM